MGQWGLLLAPLVYPKLRWVGIEVRKEQGLELVKWGQKLTLF